MKELDGVISFIHYSLLFSFKSFIQPLWFTHKDHMPPAARFGAGSRLHNRLLFFALAIAALTSLRTLNAHSYLQCKFPRPVVWDTTVLLSRRPLARRLIRCVLQADSTRSDEKRACRPLFIFHCVNRGENKPASFKVRNPPVWTGCSGWSLRRQLTPPANHLFPRLGLTFHQHHM